ncbi:polypyrimidine tract-binding protein 2-like [Halichondria panicea]|uniref:polypyrimidine tract-binding protein 2-like n=1 Tax=Halichondria panicea TaxID=6063 RepID=UPI00312BAA52
MSQGDKRFRDDISNGEPVTFVNPKELDSAAKKPRMEEVLLGVSKVLHIRNLPDNVSERDLIAFGLQFGSVTNVLLLRAKNQAFLEMVDSNTAAAMLSYYSNNPATIRDRNVFLQYSKHQELKTQQPVPVPQMIGGGCVSPVMAGGASPSSMSQGGGMGLGQGVGLGQGGGMGQGGVGLGQGVGMDPQQGIPNSVLRVIIENMLYPITIDVLHQIFSKYGNILKIVTFLKNGQFHALIQYPDTMTAATAKSALDGQNIYNGCCTLHIDLSKLSSLTVKYNNEKSRDYTRPDLSNGPGMEGAEMHGGMHGLSPGPPVHNRVPDLATALAGIPPSLLQNPALANLKAALVALTTVPPVMGGAHGMMMPGGCVVLVSNLNEHMITAHALFILFGVYGDVVRVKILYNKRDSALVQFKEPQHSQTAIANLNGVDLYGKSIHVTLSKHPQVQMPQAGSNEDGLTEDYTNSPLHRFKKPGSKNYQNIFPPSPTLHLSNIPDGVGEELITTLFTQTGGVVKKFRFFQNDHKMALTELGSTEEAISALITMHNYKISETNHLRVSFSKNPIS